MSDNPNFVTELVMMAKAFEELPSVKAELDQVKAQLEEAYATIQRRELSIMAGNDENRLLNAKLQRVEVERDHAERMFLETDDRLNAFRRLLGSFQTEAGALIAAAEPTVEPTPEPTPMPEPAVAEGVSVPSDPTPDTASSSERDLSGLTESKGLREPGEYVASTEAIPASAPIVSPTSDIVQSSSVIEGERVSDPTASSTAGDGHSFEIATPTLTADAGTDASSQTNPVDGPTDDVGYHNEPMIGASENGWRLWDDWCNRMNAKFGPGGWPPRNVPSVA